MNTETNPATAPEPVLRVEHLGKLYKLYRSNRDVIKDWLRIGGKPHHVDFWALKDINFEVMPGDFIGVLGINGAGKSTLLRILSQVCYATEGSFTITPGAISLLELGIGVDADLTGRENTIKRAKLLGYAYEDIAENIEQIKEFSELGDFFEYPVAQYSSGMKARLNFSTFAFLNSKLVILDEVLAVGDIFFKQKCYNRLQELVNSGTSIILVTHSTSSVNHFCNKVLVLHRGRQVYWGETAQGLHTYSRIVNQRDLFRRELEPLAEEELSPELLQEDEWRGEAIAWPDPQVCASFLPQPMQGRGADLVSLAVLNAAREPTLHVEQGEQVSFFYALRFPQPLFADAAAGILLVDKYNQVVHGKDSQQYQHALPTYLPAGSMVRFQQQMRLDIQPGEYVVRVWCYQWQEGRKHTLFSCQQLCSLTISGDPSARRQKFYGSSDLPGSMRVQWNIREVPDE